jgi:D-alanyl-D-alanine carboxypeptidase
MLRIRTGARDGLRWGLFGFVAAVLTLSNNPAQAAPYADIVVDANSGAVLHATNPDARRHPASLTKIMTLYLLFEQLEAGKLKLDSALKVSTEASAQAPTKLGLKPATTLSVEDAIKGMVTRSANDAAVVVAEAIAGNESEFAKVMTRKAHALGMKNTVYKNASGLPDDNQVTTARDQSILGRAIQDRFPRYYKYFSIRSFTFRGQTITNHNRLLGKVDGVDGIKTGYINASGFNLVTSVHRGNRYLVAVVMGGNTGASRDTRMRELINEKIVQASIKRTSPMVAEATPSEPVVVAKAEPKPEPMVVVKAESKPEPMPVAKAEPKPEPKVAEKIEAKAEPKAEAKTEHRYAVASAISMPARLNPAAAPAERSEPAAAATPTQARWVVGSTEPIQPVLVKTLTVRAATKTPSLIPLQVAAGATEPQPAQARAPAAVVLAKAEVAAAPPPAAVAKPETSTPVPPPVAAKPEPPVAAKPEPPAPAIIAKSEPTSPAPAAAAKAEPSPSNVTATKPESPAPVQKAFAPADATNPDAAPAAAPATSKPPSSPVAIPVPRPAAAPANPPAPAAKTAVAAAKPQHRPGWMIQVGAYPAEQTAKERLSAVQSKASKILTGAEAFTETVDKGGTTLYRARFAGLDKDAAEAACKYLKKNDVECVTIKN